jgi:hypothetical protein
VLFLLAGCAQQHFVERQLSGVTLYLEAPDATEVLFASSADSFRLHPATKGHGGLWMTDTLADREFRYFYIVDGGAYVPDCQYRESDDFGATNCIYQP